MDTGGGDFNARTGEEGGRVGIEWEEREKEGRVRRSKDRKVNREGKRLMEFLESKGWGILNGREEMRRGNSRLQEEWGAQ